MIRVALRFDDPSATSDKDLELGVIAALRDAKMPVTLAVIPFRETANGRLALNAENADHLVKAYQAGLIEIALHGHSHIRRSHSAQPSEFIGLEPVEQVALLKEGVLHLRQVFGQKAVTGFVPPWNTYDASTLAALDALEVSYVSAGWETPEGYTGSLSILPRTCQLTELRSAVAEARRFARFSPDVVAVLHHYDFLESRDKGAKLSLADLDDLFRWLRDQRDVEVVTLGTMAGGASATGFHHAIRNQQRSQSLHWRLKRRMPNTCLVNAPLWRVLLAR